MITQIFDPAKIGLIKYSFLKFSQVEVWIIQLGFRNYFILRRYRFFTTAIFIGSASTIHKSFKIMFSNCAFWCYPGYDRCLLVLRTLFLK